MKKAVGNAFNNDQVLKNVVKVYTLDFFELDNKYDIPWFFAWSCRLKMVQSVELATTYYDF